MWWRMLSRPRKAWLLPWLLAPALCAAKARAQASTCEEQYHQAQELQYAGKLLLARPLAVACAGGSACEEQTSRACRQLLATLRGQIPSLVFAIQDARGHDTDQVSLFVDDELRTEALPTTPLELDPGVHVVRAELRNGKSQSLRVVLAPGEQLRRVNISFEAKRPARPAAATGTPRWLTISLGSLALVSAGSFAYFALDGKSRADQLERVCRPRCNADPIDDMRRSYLIADVSWIVGALAAGGATWSFLAEAR